MGTQSQMNRARREIKREAETTQDAAVIYLEGVNRATRVLNWIEANYSAPFVITVQVAHSGVTAIDDDSFFTVAATPEEFQTKKAFMDMVATATMSMGILAIVDGESAEKIKNGHGHLHAWIVGHDGLPERLPVKQSVTAQLKADFSFLSPYEHVEAIPMTDLPAAA